MSKFFQEFKKFAIKGNMVDLAIGIIIGAAFNKIVTVLVEKIIMPPLGYLTAGIDMRDLKWVIKTPVKEGSEVIDSGVVIGYGEFLEALMDFGIVALTLFFVVRVINGMKDEAEDENNKTVPTPKDIQLLAEIRDEMRTMNGKVGESA